MGHFARWWLLRGGGGRITAGGSLNCLLCFLVVGHWFGTVLGLFVLSGCLLTCRVLKNILFIEKNNKQYTSHVYYCSGGS